jgi:hypothetical protein
MQDKRLQAYFVRGLIVLGAALLAFSATDLWRWTTAQLTSDAPGQNGLPVEEFPIWLRNSLNSLSWEAPERQRKLDRELLEQSLDLGRQFLVNNQTSAGNFNYEYDFIKRQPSPDDSQVRQAGALWGLALINQYQEDPATRMALDKGLDYFFKHTRQGPVPGSLLIAYPEDTECRTGTVALVALAIIEYLHSEKTGSIQIDAHRKKALSQQLSGYLIFLKYLHLEDRHFSASYSLQTEVRSPRSSPYFDGETLLCLIKAARYLGYTEFIPVIEDSALVMAKRYTIDAWQEELDSPLTKGFYQWGSMAFWEYQDAGWENSELLGDSILVLAWWMINTHQTLSRNRNTAYAYEGIIHAYRLARSRNMPMASRVLANTIDTGIYKLTGWQVNGPLEAQNPYLLQHPTNDPLAIGGVMNHVAEAPLRIDVTQHQMHAVILALNNVYTDTPDP